jgi:hypothetical protein
MKKLWSFFLLIPLTLLAGCSSVSTPKMTPLTRNGDLLDGSEATYAGVCVEQSVDRLLSRVEKGETVSFLFTSDKCSHCANWEPTFTSFLQKENYEVILFACGTMVYNDWIKSIEAIQAYFKDTTTIRVATPLLYVADKTSFSLLGGDGTSFSDLHNGFQAAAGGGAIESFRSVDAYLSFLASNPDTLTYLADTTLQSVGLSFYVSTLFPAAKSARKHLAFLDYQAMDSANQTQALTYFGLTSFAPLLKEKTTVYDLTKESEMVEATSLVQSYYR